MEIPPSAKTQTKKKSKQGPYRWTGDIIDLTELAYALLESGCINHGEVEVKAFMEFLSECFHIEIKRPSDFYYKMRSRTGSRTAFIDTMKKLLESRMDRSEEKNYTR